MSRRYLLPALCLLIGAASGAPFRAARPVWPRGLETEMNVLAGFRAEFRVPPHARVGLRVAAASLYRAYVNGQFTAWGPARGPRGFYRVDDLDITPRLVPGLNTVLIQVAGYNINSYWVLNQPSFLQAEIFTDSTVLASTGGAGAQFTGAIMTERVRKVQRYSFQRAFTEVYRLRENLPFQPVPLAVLADRNLIARVTPYPDYAVRQPARTVARGTLRRDPRVAPWRDRSLTATGPELLGFPEKDLTSVPAIRARQLVNATEQPANTPYGWEEPVHLAGSEYQLFDFGTDWSGFIGARVRVLKPTVLYLTFDEVLTHGDIDFTRLAAVNLVAYELEPGVYELESFEPYTLRFLKAMVPEGECAIDRVHLREYANPDVGRAEFSCSDAALNRLFAAGRETYRQNAVDLFTDCPQRERAGWLCDSYFTGRVEPLLSGHSKVERAFLENYLLPPRFAHLPDGMLPMCYPADHDNGHFIPNWPLWLVLELEEYAERSGDRELVDAFKPRVLALFAYFKPFQNADGLLEKLPGTVFVEWSAANNFVQDVNYPTNMLYAAALAAAGRIYSAPELTRQAGQIREAIRKQSFDGTFFVDNAVRRDGKLSVTRNRTETCQYYAFYLGTATPEAYPQLWSVLSQAFGPNGKRGGYPAVHESNTFIGDFLRMELLSRWGSSRSLLEELRATLLYMADRTGTLWEHKDERASLNHGFASHVVNVLYRDALGLRHVDIPRKAIDIAFTDSGLDWCQGAVPVGNDRISLRWECAHGVLSYRVEVPAGYRLRIENRTPYALRAVPVI